MRFLLRCIIVLSIVYSAILRDRGLLPDLSMPVARVVPEAEASAERRLVAGVGTVCGRDPAACLAGAASLGSLLAPAAESRRVRIRGAVGSIPH